MSDEDRIEALLDALWLKNSSRPVIDRQAIAAALAAVRIDERAKVVSSFSSPPARSATRDLRRLDTPDAREFWRRVEERAARAAEMPCWQGGGRCVCRCLCPHGCDKPVPCRWGSGAKQAGGLDDV